MSSLFGAVLKRLVRQEGASAGLSVIGIFVLLGAANLGAWLWAWLAFHDRPILLGTCFLAYGFGLRHAVDADHIAAIDNVTRKLMQEGKRPIAVGFFFSLGHSTVVVLATAAIAFTASALEKKFAAFKQVGGMIGTTVSVFFLFLIALLNIVIFAQTYRAFHRVRRGDNQSDAEVSLQFLQGGVLGRIFRPLFGVIRESWHMYPLGFLFGLGFDTATEVGLLALAGGAAAGGLPWFATLSLPLLFAAGMSMMDTADGAFMNVAYGWAFSKPVRKVFYNITITGLSVAVALLVGTIELFSIIAQWLGLSGPFWDRVSSINLNVIGFIIVGMFVATWVIALAVWHFGHIEERWSRPRAPA